MHHIKIQSAAGFDGFTPLDMSSPVYDRADDRYDYIVAGPVGFLPLFTMPEEIGGGNVDLWFQRIESSMPGIGATVAQQAPNRLQIPLYTGGSAPPLGDTTRYNFVHPTQWALFADNAQAGAGIIDIYLELLGNSNWYLVQCCHQYTPIPRQGPGPS